MAFESEERVEVEKKVVVRASGGGGKKGEGSPVVE